MAEKALTDEKPEVRSSAAAALGAMHSKASIAKLREAADDQDPSVALAAAHALIALKDDSGYEVYYEVLTGERKGGKGVIASQSGGRCRVGEASSSDTFRQINCGSQGGTCDPSTQNHAGGTPASQLL